MQHPSEEGRKAMRNRLGLLLIVVLALSWTTGRVQSQTPTGFHISGRNLLDANGNNFIMRGISHAHTWYPAQTGAFANIKNAAANTVRVVLSSGARWTKNSASDVANVINLCKTNRLICVLEVHDTTGYGEQSGAISLAQAVTYWKEIQSVLTGQEAYVIINLGNEPYGNVNAAGWINDTINAIAEMRSAGFGHTLMVDAPNWGQDWQFIMRDNAATIFDSDPDRNTVFSIHMYGVFNTASKVQSYVSTFVNRGLPLVIGEFGWYHTDGDPDEDAIMAQAQSNEIGYMGWSWSGNGGGVEYLDMVTSFDPNQRTTWGTRIITGANGLQLTSHEASVYGGDPTSVELLRFEAWPEGPRSIHVQWETSQEIDNLGLNLYRSNTRAGVKVRLNKSLIPTAVPPGSPFGAVYDWSDGFRLRSGGTYFYWLEDLDIYGYTTMHGPVRVKVP
jgi:mannan endo-1,4-beta-mannosidase